MCQCCFVQGMMEASGAPGELYKCAWDGQISRTGMRAEVWRN